MSVQDKMSELGETLQAIKDNFAERPKIRIDHIVIYREFDTDPDTTIDRQERGQWCFYGIYAVAVVKYSNDGGKTYRLESLRSGGIWGVESDSGAEEIASMEKDELSDLRDHLTTFGVDVADFDDKVAIAQHMEK